MCQGLDGSGCNQNLQVRNSQLIAPRTITGQPQVERGAPGKRDRMETQSDAEHAWRRRIRSTLPVIGWLPQYQRSWLRPDMVAGLTLAAYAVPVSVAYASLAGLPPQAGLYCYLVGGVAYAVFGTSRQLAVGPTSAISILIGSALGTLAAGDALHQSHLAAAVAVLAGVIGIVAWVLRLGNIVNFVSETVLGSRIVGLQILVRDWPVFCNAVK